MIQCYIRNYEEGYRYKTDSQPKLLLIYLLQGELLLSAPGKWVRLEQGFVGVFPMGSTVYLECTKDFKGLYLCDDELSNNESFQGASGCEGDTALKVVAELLRLELLKETLSATVMQSLGVSFFELTKRLLIEQEKPTVKTNESHLKAQKALQKMKDNLYSKLPLDVILNSCGVGYRQISRYLKEKKGESPKQIFMQLKMQEVCRLLKETNYSVTTISLELGFASSQHLSTLFKTYYGLTPKQYKEQQKQIYQESIANEKI